MGQAFLDTQYYSFLIIHCFMNNGHMDKGGNGRSSGLCSGGSPGSCNNSYFDGNAAKRALLVLVPVGKIKPSYAEQKVLKNVWIKKTSTLSRL